MDPPKPKQFDQHNPWNDSLELFNFPCQWIGRPSKRKTTLNILNWKVIFHVHIWEWIVAICNYNTVQQYYTMNDVRNFAAVKTHIFSCHLHLENKKQNRHTHTPGFWKGFPLYLPLGKHPQHVTPGDDFWLKFRERPKGGRRLTPPLPAGHSWLGTVVAHFGFWRSYGRPEMEGF